MAEKYLKSRIVSKAGKGSVEVIRNAFLSEAHTDEQGVAHPDEVVVRDGKSAAILASSELGASKPDELADKLLA